MGKLIEILQGEDGRLSFSRMWGAGFGLVVVVLYIASYFMEKPLPGQTLPLLAVAMAPYVSAKGAEVIRLFLDR